MNNWADCTSGAGQVASLECFPMIFGYIIDWVLLFAGVVLVFFIILSGISYITSGGDQKKLDSSKKTLTYSILGFALILLSFFIIRLIAHMTGVECINKFGFSCK